MIVYLVRHARAGKRGEWDGEDRLRPLDERGRRQADALVGQLADRDFSRIVSSPYLRCVESVVPLAQARELELERSDALSESAGVEPALALFAAADTPLVACVHGDLVEALLGEKARKGSTTVIEVTGERVVVLERIEAQA